MKIPCPRCGKGLLEMKGEGYVENGIEYVNVYFLCPVCNTRYVSRPFVAWR